MCLPPVHVHSPDVIGPLLTEEMPTSPEWLCWLKLVELYTLSVQHTLTMRDIQRLDDLQLEHTELFHKVLQYRGLRKPKHHFLTHLAMDAWRFGPPRGYWCFGFESFNKVIKAGSKRSNYKNEVVSIMEYWSLRSAGWLSA